MRHSDIMGGDCIAKKDSWALSSGPLAVTQPPKVLADGFLPICHQCNLLGHDARASLVLPQVASWCREKQQLSSWQCFWHIAHYRGGGGGLFPRAAQPCQTQPGLTSERDRKYTTQIRHLSLLCPEYQPQVAQSFQPSIRVSESRGAVLQQSIKTWKLFQEKGRD